MAELLIRLLKRIQPREGWAVFVLVLLAVLCAPLALRQVTRAPGAEQPIWLAVAGVLVGLGLARSRLPARAAAAAGALLGSGLVVVALGRLVPPLSLLWSEAGYLVTWLRGWLQGTPQSALPFAATAAFVWQRLAAFAGRVSAWVLAATGAEAAPQTPDQTGFLLLMAVLAWAAGVYAAWQVFRKRSPLAGLLPSGAGIVLVVFLSGGGRLLLLVFLFCMLGAVAGMHLWSRQQRWAKTGVDYPDGLGFDLALVVLPWLLIAVTVAAVFPYVRSRPISRAFWQVMDQPWSAVEIVTKRIFGEIESQYTGGFGPGEMPRDHLLAGAPSLGDAIILYVTTSDPAPPPPELEDMGSSLPPGPRRYWRGIVYDVYTGRGWDHSQLTGRSYRPDQPLEPNAPAGSELQQAYDIVEPASSQLYAANQPLSIDQTVQAWWRGTGDLAYLEGDAWRYRVVSRPPEPTVSELRSAPSVVPPEVAALYLALPDSLPLRIPELVLDVTAGTATRYDQVAAIESFLRTYTYTLDVPLPPQDRDLVDYFLFDLRSGYCDYYASAMVVMARSLGIPARLASGYVQGTYDYDSGRWVVRERDAHSWPEVYFEGIGWVEFEPTAGQPPLVRPPGTGLGMAQVKPPQAGDLLGIRGLVPLLALGVVLVLLIAGIAAIWWPRRATALDAGSLVRDRYHRLLQWGNRLHQPLRTGQTPHEYGTALGDALAARGSRSRRAGARAAADEAPAEVETLTDSFVRVQFGARPVDEREGRRIRTLWERLRRHLWRLLFR